MFLVNYLVHHDMFYFTEQGLIGDLLTFNSIRIPVLETYDIFRTHMINTILTVKEFGDY